MKVGLLLVASLAFFTGCADEPGSNHFLVDTRFEDCPSGFNCELEVMRHVADEFRLAFKSPEADITLEHSLNASDFSLDDWEDYDGENAKIYRISFSEPMYKDLANEIGQDFYGLARSDKAIALVWEPYMHNGILHWPVMEQIVMHEFGHHIGLHHGDGSMMDEPFDTALTFYDNYPCVDQRAVDVFCRDHQCDGTQKTTCE